MTTEWTPMEPMQSDCANHEDLFGGDIFSDELLDIYNSEDVNGGTGHDGVPLSNGKRSSSSSHHHLKKDSPLSFSICCVPFH